MGKFQWPSRPSKQVRRKFPRQASLFVDIFTLVACCQQTSFNGNKYCCTLQVAQTYFNTLY